jgi:hypothetical protein
MLPEMSQRTTRFGQRVTGALWARLVISPPWRSASRRVRRASMRAVRVLGAERRVFSGCTGSDELRQHPLGGGDFLGRHLFEVEGFQPFFGGHGGGGVDLDLVAVGVGLGRGRKLAVQQRLGGAFLGGLGDAIFLHAVDLGQQQRHHVVEIARVAPEQAKDLREKGAFFGAGDEDGLQGEVEILAPVEACGGDGAHGVEGATGADGKARLAQRAGEMGDVVGELAVFGDVEGA